MNTIFKLLMKDIIITLWPDTLNVCANCDNYHIKSVFDSIT